MTHNAPEDTEELPVFRRRPGRPYTYGFHRLREAGDAFYASPADVGKVRSAASNYKKLHPGWDYTTIFTEDGRLKVCFK